LTPLVTHCQIWPFCTGGSAVACARAAGSGAVSGSGTEAGTRVGAAATTAVSVVSVGTVATLAEVAAVAGAGNDGESGADVTCVLAAPGDKLGGAVLPAEATVMTTATAATDSPPRTQGSKPVWFFMA